MELGYENIVQILTNNAIAYVSTGRVIEERYSTIF